MTIVLTERVQLRDGIAFADTVRESEYRDRWEREAEEDHIRSAIARAPAGGETEELLTAKTTPLLRRFPQDLHVRSLLDVGAGYGRIELYLAREKRLSCDSFCAVDISAGMLRRLVEYRARFRVFPGADVQAVCALADDLPIADASVDLVISSAVFLHMGKRFVGRAVREIARVLRPGGGFLFDTSFPNSRNPATWPARLKPAPLRNPNALKYWTRPEVERLLRESGLAARAGSYRVEPTSYALLPKTIGPLRVPLARRVNAVVVAPRVLPDFFAHVYGAVGGGLA